MNDLRHVADDPSQAVSFGVGFNFGLLIGLFGVIVYIMVVRVLLCRTVRLFLDKELDIEIDFCRSQEMKTFFRLQLRSSVRPTRCHRLHYGGSYSSLRNRKSIRKKPYGRQRD